MAGDPADETIVKSQEFQDMRQKLGPEKVDAFVRQHAVIDPGKYLPHAAPTVLFFQFATQEKFLTPERAKATAALASEPKETKVYDAPHALNAEARRDRLLFLADQLHVKPPAPDVISSIPALPQPPEPPQ